jgi:hypothetical protein
MIGIVHSVAVSLRDEKVFLSVQIINERQLPIHNYLPRKII